MPWSYGETVCIVVPGPPKPLERNRHRIVKARSGATFVSNYTPAKSRNEQAVIRDMADQQMNGRAPFEGPIDLRFVAYMPVPASWSKRKQDRAIEDWIRPTGKPDADNFLKMVDALKGIVWRDDAQVTDCCLWKRYSVRPRTIIEVRPMTWEDPEQRKPQPVPAAPRQGLFAH